MVHIITSSPSVIFGLFCINKTVNHPQLVLRTRPLLGGGHVLTELWPHVGLHHVIVSQMFLELCFLTCFSARVIEENAANDARQCQTGDLSPGLLPVVVPD